MDEQTTTSNPAQDTGADLLAEPVTAASDEAAQQPAEPTEQPKAPVEPEGPPDPAQPATDDNLEWLKSKGVDPSDPEAVRKVADMYRNAEKAMHQSTAKASELEKTLTTGLQQDAASADPDAVTQLAAEVQGLKLAQTVNGFFAENPDAKAHEPRMTEIVNERPEIGQLVKAGYLSVSDLYQMARGGDTSLEAAARQQGGKEALQQVASKQQAKAVTGVATNSDFSTAPEDAFASGFDNVK